MMSWTTTLRRGGGGGDGRGEGDAAWRAAAEEVVEWMSRFLFTRKMGRKPK